MFFWGVGGNQKIYSPGYLSPGYSEVDTENLALTEAEDRVGLDYVMEQWKIDTFQEAIWTNDLILIIENSNSYSCLVKTIICSQLV